MNRAEEPLSTLVAAVRGATFVGLDGRSGAGKSTLALALAEHLAGEGISVTTIEGDDFYTGGSSATWDGRSAVQKADQVIDWRRERAILEQLRAGVAAHWHPFDWDADDWDADLPPRLATPLRAEPAQLVVLEGAYSCRPELHDLLDLRVLLETPTGERHRRLAERDGPSEHADWDRRWASAEAHYFSEVMPPYRFDLVLRDRRR